MYNVANQQPGLEPASIVSDVLALLQSKRKNTGSMKQLGQMRRQKLNRAAESVKPRPPTRWSSSLNHTLRAQKKVNKLA